MAINDFGEKIGGAKKDLWRARGLMIEDLLNMNDAEKITFIKKDNVWQKPNYQELVDSGIPRRVVYFMKKIRDATPTKPVLGYSDTSPERIAEKQKGYISFVRELRDAVLALRTEADVLGFYENYLKKNYITSNPGSYYVQVSEKAYDCIDNKLLKAAQIRTFTSIDRDIAKKQFCYSEQDKQAAFEKAFTDQFDIFQFDNDRITFNNDYSGRLQVAIKLMYGTHYFYPQGEDADRSSYEEGKWLILRRGKVIAKNLDSREDAKAYVKKLFEASKKLEAEQPAQHTSKRKTRFTPRQLQGIQRVGEDYRHGVPATGEKYMKVFGFKGGEFGNWMSENDRRASLDYGYDALLDMCKALNISTKDISLGGRLSIAFGARGSAGAAAHYEPLREVINLTKMHGAGSLAHEWAHAMDDILGKTLGLSQFMTENIRKAACPSTLKTLVDSMHYKEVHNDEIIEKQKKDIEAYQSYVRRVVTAKFPTKSMSEAEIKRLEALTDAFIDKAKDCSEAFGLVVMTGEGNKEIEDLSALKKEVSGHILNKEQRVDLAHYQNNLRMKLERLGTPEKVRTDFYEQSIQFDHIHSKTDHGYWQSTIEMFARAFACYVHDKIEGKSDYLVGHSESAATWAANKRTGEMEIIKAIPEGEERTVLNRCFDNLIVELKEKGLFHDYEPIQELRAERKPSLFEQIKSCEAQQPAPVKENGFGQLEFDL